MRQILTLILLAVITVPSLSIERKEISAIDADQLTNETQFSASCGGDHMNFSWWIPVEFWEAVFEQDDTVIPSEKKRIVETFRPYTIIAVCQADIGTFGSFKYYSKEEVGEGMTVYLQSGTKRKRKISPVTEVDKDLELVLDIMKPILSAAMGNLGQNLHFYVFDNYTKKEERLFDPYKEGKLEVELRKRSKEKLLSGIEFPVNALFVPRLCPNGNEAHVSWEFCPWTGEKLPE